MADGTIQLPPDSTGTKLRTFTNPAVDDGAHQEVVSVALSDGTLDTTIAALLSGLRGAPAGTLEAIRALLSGTLAVAGTVTVSNPTTSPETGLAKDVTLPKLVGTWSYLAGANGTFTVAAGRRVVGIAVHSTAGGSFTINAGASIPVPAATAVAITPNGQLVAPTITADAGCDSVFIELVL